MPKVLNFDASISDVKRVNPLFSTCKVRVLYLGNNRNYTKFSKESVEKALPTLLNIPIVGEYADNDYKGHGGTIDLDEYKFIHTTKPYGVVPESATFEWEEVKGRDGTTREYLTINGCYLWTGRYEEAYDVIENGKGQSMEIEVNKGRWLEEEETYQIDDFVFSALCILGDDVEPAFEDAKITGFSLDKDKFKDEFSTMLKELKYSLQEKEDVNMLKELLEKYSLTVEQLTEKGIDFNAITEDELEAKIIEVFNLDVENKDGEEDNNKSDDENKDNGEGEENLEGKEENPDSEPENVSKGDEQPDAELSQKVEDLEKQLSDSKDELFTAKETIKNLNDELEELRNFKLNVQKDAHEKEVKALFTAFQLSDEEVADIDIHSLTKEEVEAKCFEILGRKFAKKADYSKKGGNGIRIDVGSTTGNEDKEDEFSRFLEKYGDK